MTDISEIMNTNVLPQPANTARPPAFLPASLSAILAQGDVPGRSNQPPLQQVGFHRQADRNTKSRLTDPLTDIQTDIGTA